MKLHRLFIMLLCISFSLIAQGCLSVGVYRTAEIMPEGEGDFTMTFTAVRVEGQQTTDSNVDAETGEVTTEEVQHDDTVLPNLVPELAYHIGVAEDLEVGGRIVVMGGLMELDLKYRFLGSTGDALQMAIQPAIGYRAMGVIEGLSASLPIITTYSATDTIAFNVAPYISYTDFTATDDSFASLGGSWLSAGGSVGIKVQGKTMYFMPQVEVSKMIQNLESEAGSSDSDSTIVMFGVTVGFSEGREMTKLEDMDKKIDKLMEK